MRSDADWLPVIICLEHFGGDWKEYLEATYEIFRRDFVVSQPSFRGQSVGLKRFPIYDEKESTFWHAISGGPTEEERVPDLRRCERVPWIRPVIEHEAEPAIRIWPQERKGEKRVALWFEDKEYMVIIARRKEKWLLWTTFMVSLPHQIRKRKREYIQNRMKPI